MTPWSLRRRLATAIWALAALVIALIVVAALLLGQVRARQHDVISRYFTAVTLTNERFIQQIDAETAVRGYALTADPTTLQPAKAFKSASYRADGARIQSLLAGDSGVETAFHAWDAAANTWDTQWAQPTIRRVRADGRGSVSDTEVLAGKALFDTNRARYSAFGAQLVSKRDAASKALRLRTTLLFGAVLLLTLGVAVAGAAVWWALRRWVLLPLGSLGTETKIVTGGDLDHEVHIRGPSEVEALADDVEAMRRDLVAQLAVVEHARNEIQLSRQQLETQAAELARSNRDLEQFAYVASHDLQEPLRKIASFCQLLERRYRGNLDERADQYIDFVIDGAKRMQQLINDLLAFSRVGRTSRTFVDVDLQSCVDHAIGNLGLAIQAAGASIDTGELPHVPGDAALLTQLFQNLIANAVKFRGQDPPHIEITARRAGGGWELSCADNGIGVEPQYAERVFVIFQRLHGREEYPGTGIGLALCKRIVEYHGGQMWLDSSASRGATFRWTLPASDHAGDTREVGQGGGHG